MDPQQRLVLETGYESLQESILTNGPLLASCTGVALGIWTTEFAACTARSPAAHSAYASTGTSLSVACGRVSYVLGMHGPCVSVDTACSASLAACHTATQALNQLECVRHLVAGVNLLALPSSSVMMAAAGMTSSTGRSYSFDRRADGFIRGEGVNAVALMHHVSEFDLRGSAVRQDGRSASLTAPNGVAQRALILAALDDAKVSADDLVVNEAHGTGTILGDPIEVRSLVLAVLQEHQPNHVMDLTAGKASVGHGESTAGLAGMQRLVHELRHNLSAPNSQLRLLNTNVKSAVSMLCDGVLSIPSQLSHKLAPLPSGGVSAFGYSGTIAHTILCALTPRSTPACFDTPPPFYRRRIFSWDEPYHPLISYSLRLSDGAEAYRAASAAWMAMLRDHRVAGMVVVPAAAQVEAAHGARCSSIRTADATVQLESVAFVAPLILDESGSEMYIECRLTASRFEVLSETPVKCGEQQKTVHCTGMFSSGLMWKSASARLMRTICTNPINQRDIYDANFERDGVQLHAGFQVVRQLWASHPKHAVARLRTRSDFQGTLVHPADIDSLLATSVQLASSTPGFLPFVIRDITLTQVKSNRGLSALIAPMPKNAPAAGSLIVGDSALVDWTDDVPVVRLRGLILRMFASHNATKATTRSSRTTNTFMTNWQQQAGAAGEDMRPNNTLMLCCVSPSRHGRAMLKSPHALTSVAHVVIIYDAKGLTSLSILDGAMSTLQAQTCGGTSSTVWICSQQSRIEANAILEQGSLCGMCRSAKTEEPLPVICLDNSKQQLLHVLKECDTDGSVREDERRLTCEGRVVPRLEGFKFTPKSTLSSDKLFGFGRHVITGGTAGLGILTGRWLAQRGALRLVLASRSGRFTPGSSIEVSAMRGTRCAVLLVQCNVGEESDVKQRIMRVIEGQGSAWHASGTLADALVRKQSATSFAHVHTPKACSARILQRGLANSVTGVLFFFSSVSALLGGAGQCNYSSANAYLDQLASSRRTHGVSAASVQWGPWANIGMVVRAGVRDSEWSHISPANGLAALCSLTACNAPSVASIFSITWTDYLSKRAKVPAVLSIFSTSTRTSVSSALALNTASVSLAEVLEVVRRSSGNDVNVDAPLMDAGIDSLGFIEVRNQLQRMVGLPLSSTFAFEHPTARQLTSALQEQTPSTTATPSMSLDDVINVVERAAGEKVDVDAPLMEVGIDSLGLIELRNQLQAYQTGVLLPSTLVFEHPTARQLAFAMTPTHMSPTVAVDHGSTNSFQTSVGLYGCAAIIPAGACSPYMMGATKACGRNTIVEIPTSRWDVNTSQSTSKDAHSRMRHTGFVQGAELIDCAVFSISPAEAMAMDPCQRLLLEHGYSALHDATSRRSSLSGSVTGVFLGFAGVAFSDVLASSPMASSVYAMTGSFVAIAAGRLSYLLGLHGAAIAYDTACSAALAAGHAGTRALQCAECNTGLVMGVTLMLVPSIGVSFAVAGMTSIRGRSHTFDARADGYARGEACGAVTIRRDVMNSMLAVLGSVVRNDGRSASITAPNGKAQHDLIVATMATATTTADKLILNETHGTGTTLGDPIEAGSLSSSVLNKRGATPVAVGSIKANMGHSEVAAGMAGLIGLTVGVKNSDASPNAQLRVLNPFVSSAVHALPCTLPSQLAALSTLSTDGGVSSFGFSGTLVHAIVRYSTHKSNHSTLRLLYRRRAFAWRMLAASDGSRHVISMERRLAEARTAQAALDGEVAFAATVSVPEHTSVGIVGAGLAGILIATRFVDSGVAPVLLERTATIGGVWRQFGNAFSRVNSSEPSYRLRVKREKENTNHSHYYEILNDALRTVEQHSLLQRIYTHAHVLRASSHHWSWNISGCRPASKFQITCGTAIICTNRRLGRPRELDIPGEATFGGLIRRGLGGDVNTLQCAGMRVVVLGMGAFAIENMRTCFERGAIYANILCRRRGTVCPQIVDWVNFARPREADLSRSLQGDAITFSYWQQAYDSSYAVRPDCWRDRVLKPDGHTVSTSDMFFIAHRLKMLTTLLGDAAIVNEQGIETHTGEQLSAHVLIKCVGFEVNSNNEHIVGRSRMHGTGLIERSLWMQAEAHLDSRAFNSYFGSSYLNGVDFGATLLLHYFHDTARAALLMNELRQQQQVRLSTFMGSEVREGINMLATHDMEVSQLLRHHLQAVEAACHATASPDLYIANNSVLWTAIHHVLKGSFCDVWSYPFSNMWDELTMQDPASRWGQIHQAGMSLENVIDAAKQVIGKSSINVDAPLMDMGLDSLGVTELRTSLEAASGVELPATLVFEAPTARLIALTFGQRPSAPMQDPASRCGQLHQAGISLENVIDAAKQAIGKSSISLDAPLMDMGLDSLGVTELRTSLEAASGIELPATLVFEAPTARLIALTFGQRPSQTPPALAANTLHKPNEMSLASYLMSRGLGAFLPLFEQDGCATVASMSMSMSSPNLSHH